MVHLGGTEETGWSLLLFFFFSSRRRHTRLTCDWSSDVCSSDLELRHATSKTTLTRQQIQELIEQCADTAAALRDADPADMRSEERRVGKECRTRGAP